MFSIVPKETNFFEKFEQAAETVRWGSAAFVDFLANFENRVDLARRIKEAEHRGDNQTHEILALLNETFVTPIDRDDIHELACRLDDVLDLIDVAAGRMVLYKIKSPTEDARKLADCLSRSTETLVSAIKLLRNMKNHKAIAAKCIEINEQENEADSIMHHALAGLFDGSFDPVEIIKWKDIYQDIESATDRCEDVANVIEGIVLKNA